MDLLLSAASSIMSSPQIVTGPFRLYLADLVTYQAVDSVRSKKIDLDNVAENAVALALYRWLLQPYFKNGPLREFTMDYEMLEDYLIRLGSLIIGKSLLKGNLQSTEGIVRDVKDQLFYQLGTEFRIKVLGKYYDAAPRVQAAATRPAGSML